MNETEIASKELWQILIGGYVDSPIAGIGVRGDTVVIYLKRKMEGKALLRKCKIGNEYNGIKVEVCYVGQVTL